MNEPTLVELLDRSRFTVADIRRKIEERAKAKQGAHVSRSSLEKYAGGHRFPSSQAAKDAIADAIVALAADERDLAEQIRTAQRPGKLSGGKKPGGGRGRPRLRSRGGGEAPQPTSDLPGKDPFQGEPEPRPMREPYTKERQVGKATKKGGKKP